MATRTMEYTYIKDEARPFVTTEGMIARIIDLFVAVIEALLALRLVLHFLGANPGNAFMMWLDSVTSQLLAPFSNIFPSWGAGPYVIEISTIFAMLAYAVIGWLLIRIMYFLSRLMRSA